MKKAFLTFLLCISLGAAVAQPNSKFTFHFEGGIGAEVKSTHNLISEQLFFSPSYNLNKQWMVGIGIGQTYSFGNATSWLYPEYSYKVSTAVAAIPLYAHATYTMPLGKKVEPFASFKAGYGVISKRADLDFSTPNDDLAGSWKQRGGAFLSPSVGIKLNLNPSNALTFALAYDFQASSSIINVSDFSTYIKTESPRINHDAHTISFRFGWMFRP